MSPVISIDSAKIIVGFGKSIGPGQETATAGVAKYPSIRFMNLGPVFGILSVLVRSFKI